MAYPLSKNSTACLAIVGLCLSAVTLCGCGMQVLPELPEPVALSNPAFESRARSLDKDEVDLFYGLLRNPGCLGPRFDSEDIFVLDTTDSTVRRITSTPVEERYPAISDCGQKIVFCLGSIFVLDLKTMEYVELLDGRDAWDTKWIPRKDAISFLAATGSITATTDLGTQTFSCADIFSVDETGENAVNLTNTPDTDEFAYDWSRDGTQLAYVERQPNSDENYKVWIRRDWGAGKPALVLETPRRISKVAWGADSDKLYCAFHGGDSGWSLGAVSVERGGLETLAVDGLGPSNWDVSHMDGSFVALKQWPGAKAPRGVSEYFDSSFAEIGNSPSWCNSGRYVVYTKNSLPEGFLDDLEQGVEPERFRVIVIGSDGSINYRTDVFNQLSPIATEWPETHKKKHWSDYRSLTKTEAATLVEKWQLREMIDVDQFYGDSV